MILLLNTSCVCVNITTMRGHSLIILTIINYAIMCVWICKLVKKKDTTEKIYYRIRLGITFVPNVVTLKLFISYLVSL